MHFHSIFYICECTQCSCNAKMYGHSMLDISRAHQEDRVNTEETRLHRIQESIGQIANEIRHSRHSRDMSGRLLAEVEHMLKSSTAADTMINAGSQTPKFADSVTTTVETETDLLNRIMDAISFTVNDSQPTVRPKTFSQMSESDSMKRVNNTYDIDHNSGELYRRPIQKQNRAQKVKRVRRKTQTSPTLLTTGPASNFPYEITSNQGGQPADVQGYDTRFNQWSIEDALGYPRPQVKHMTEVQLQLFKCMTVIIMIMSIVSSSGAKVQSFSSCAVF